MSTSTLHTHSLDAQLANCRDYWLGWGAPAGAGGPLTYFRSGIAEGQLNGVLRLTGTTTAEDSMAYARGQLSGLPWMWWVGPDSAPGTETALTTCGAVRLGAMPIMALETDKADPAAAAPDDLRIETVTGEPALREWVATYTPSFGVPAGLRDDVARNEIARPDSARITRFLGRRAGRPVATALLYAAHGVAGVYVVTTAEDQRRQGIGTALTAAALAAGRERGLRLATLQSSPDGFPVYRRMGFETVAEYGLYQFPTDD
ncbi:GNAT family N-acetyltransferase [Streptomyces sp. NPDC088387]|uniref:GNAT family N-acetyltransferase n=1 Tax=Streptomyces sp. NPDC088387 TaxID=3365859 RepID=UPI003800948C